MAGDTALWALFVAALLVATTGLLRYRTLLNPLTVSTVTDTGLTTLLTGVFAYHFLALGRYSDADVAHAAGLSSIYLFGILVPYLFRGTLLARLFASAMGIAGLNSSKIGATFRSSKFALLLSGALVASVALAVSGGGGWLWVTSPRTAYLLHRSGAGQFWLLTAWFHITALLYYLWARRPRGLRLVVTIVVFTLAVFFLGSKAIILTVAVVSVVYYHFLVRPIPTMLLVLCGVAGVAAFLGLLFFQGSYSDWAGVASYFENYQITAEFLGRFKEFGYQYGKAWLSSFWFFVPRVLYPGKPLEYGPILIQKQLLPGAYEMGYAPGFLTWSMSYLDFGWLGVFVAGLSKGAIQRAAYEHFLRRRESFFAFVLMLQLSIWGIFAFASFSVALIWCVAQAIVLRLVLVHRHPDAVHYVPLEASGA